MTNGAASRGFPVGPVGRFPLISTNAVSEWTKILKDKSRDYRVHTNFLSCSGKIR